MKRQPRDPAYIAWVAFLLFLLLCGVLLLWAGILKGKPLPRIPTTNAVIETIPHGGLA